MTKQFVAAGLLKLVEQNKVNLNDPVSKFLPNFRKIEVITLKNLLNHASGLINFTDIENFWKLSEDGKINSDDDIIEFALQYPL